MTERLPRPQVLALLHAAKETPDDDTPRLVLADWLEENGDEHDVARGQFIRCQCERARLCPDNRLGQHLRDREAELERQHGDYWWPSLPRWVTVQRSERGLLTCATRKWSSTAPPGFQCNQEELAWVNRLECTDHVPNWANEGLVRVLEGVNSIEIRHQYLELAVEVLGAVPLTLLLEFTISNRRIDHLEMAALSRLTLTRLRRLLLSANRIGDRAMQRLAEWPALGSVERLVLNDNDFKADGAFALAASPHLRRLTALHLDLCLIGDDGAEALATSPILESVEVLSVRSCRIRDTGAAALAASPYLNRVERLALGSDCLRYMSRTTRTALLNRFGGRIVF